MGHALIITGGGAPKALEDLHLESYRFIVVADSGIEFAVKHDLFADIWVGDFDSAQIRPERVGEIIHKDHDMKLESDTELALMIGRERGMAAYTLIGGGGYRMDHLLQTYSLFDRYGLPLAWHTTYESLYSVHRKRRFITSAGRTLSFLPASFTGESVVNASDLVWPLKEYRLTTESISLSNRTAADVLDVSVEGDPIFLCFPVADTGA
ncbi:MAG TPA: thiamine pyrophosphokinase [Sphaerochaeta sp.]|jgi:thiamine pyrophosphokinase|nr:thiamine pyrophosphokinase [Spirochaetales bacterium]HPX28281.1 thiamine pyrophosphokinase [Sphaerochaeta sp.]HQB54029.1 thiamine pyrophosphokinase [Sphaerochaeta sp.]